MASLEIDNMEYASDALAQAGYVSTGVEVADQSQTSVGQVDVLGDVAGNEYREAQGFTLSSDTEISAVEIQQSTTPGAGSPTGSWTLRIETNNAGAPSGTLANANASIAVTPPGLGNNVKGTFAISFTLTASTLYWLVVQCDNQSTNNYWRISVYEASNLYAGGIRIRSTNGTWINDRAGDMYFKVYKKQTLNSYSEQTIKTQGSYALKVVAAAETVIDDENMADITDWTDGDTGTGESSQVTFDSKSCMKLYSGTTDGVSRRTKDVGTFGARTVFSYNIYCDSIGLYGTNQELDINAWDGTNRLGIQFCSDGLFIFDGATWNEVGTNLVVQDVWQEWKFDCTWGATVNVYLNGLLVASNVDCSFAEGGYVNGTIEITQRGYTIRDRLSYIDWLKVTDGASLYKTLTKTFAINSDLTRVNNIKIDMRTSRTGSNIKLVLENNTTFVAASQLSGANEGTLGDAGDVEYARFQTFPLTAGGKIKSIDIWFGANQGSPSGNVTCRIETVSNGLPSGTLAESHLTATFSPTASAKNTISFTGAEEIPAGQYAITLVAPNQSNNQGWLLIILYPEGYTDGAFGTSTNAGATWASLADRDLKFSVNVKIKHELIPNVITADTFQTVSWDLSGVADADKNAIDKFIITPTNADAANTIYLDNFYATLLTHYVTI